MITDRDSISFSVLVSSSEEYPRHSEATVIEVRKGVLLLGWSRFQGRRKAGERSDHILESDNDASDIAGLWSTDGGETWTDEHVIIPNSAGLNVMSPAFARLRDGALGLMYSHRDSEDSACRVFCRSDDEGLSWHDCVRLTDDGYVTGTHDRLTVLSDGRIIAPLHYTQSWYGTARKTRIAWSDDNGRSWAFSAPVEVPTVPAAIESGGWEPGVTELRDGRILLLLRTAMGTLYRAESHDHGESWKDLRPLEVTSPIAPGLMRRVPESDDLLLFWNWHFDLAEPMFGRRTRFAMAVSHDDGESWPIAERRVLEDDPEFTFSYPSCTIVDQTALVTYYAARSDSQYGARSLKLARIPL